jgi:hypothetical protein
MRPRTEKTEFQWRIKAMTNETRRLIDCACSIHVFRTRQYRRALLLATFVFACLFGPGVARVWGQDDPLQPIGAPPFSTKLPVENGSIDAATGNLHLEFPLGTFPQRGGPPLKVALTYDSSIWDPYWGFANIPGGWRFVSSSDSGGVNYNSYTYRSCVAYGGETDVVDIYDTWTWIEADGTQHAFPIQTSSFYYDPDCPTEDYPEYDVPNGDGFAEDASGYHMYVTGYWYATVYAPDGTLVYSDSLPPGSHDTNGNYYSNGIDTLKRTPVSGSTSGSTTTYTVTGASGTKTWTATWSSVNYNTDFIATDPGHYDTSGSMYQISAINLPDGTSYTFGYDSGTSSGHYGQMTSMTLPTGSTIYYTYNNNFVDSEYYVSAIRRPSGQTRRVALWGAI